MSDNKATTERLFDRLGGVSAVRAVIDQFYERLLKDPALFRFFEGVNISKLKLHQIKFLRLAFTEIPKDLDVSAHITDKHMRLFVDMGLTEIHFDMVAMHLVASLQHLGVCQELIDEVVAVVGPLRPIFLDAAQTYGGKKPGDAHTGYVLASFKAEPEQAPAPIMVKKSKLRRWMRHLSFTRPTASSAEQDSTNQVEVKTATRD